MSSCLSHEVPWGAQGNLWPSPDKLMRRVLSEERGGCCSPRPGCGYSRATRRGTSHPLNCRRFQPSQSTDPHQPAFKKVALGSPVGVGIEGLAGEVESSCSCPREAMNLVHVRRISRRKPNCKLVPTHRDDSLTPLAVRAASNRDVSPGRRPWYSCPARLGFVSLESCPV